MPLPQNSLDLIASDLAVWADDLSTKIAEAIKGGLSAPGAAQLSAEQKLRYYTAAYFNPDGSPNYQGRSREIDRLGPLGFADTMREVLRAHPEYRQAAPRAAPRATPPVPLPVPQPVPALPPGGLEPVVAPERMPITPPPPPVPGAY